MFWDSISTHDYWPKLTTPVVLYHAWFMNRVEKVILNTQNPRHGWSEAAVSILFRYCFDHERFQTDTSVSSEVNKQTKRKERNINREKKGLSYFLPWMIKGEKVFPPRLSLLISLWDLASSFNKWRSENNGSLGSPVVADGEDRTKQLHN